MREYKKRYATKYPERVAEKIRRYCMEHGEELRRARVKLWLSKKIKAYTIVGKGKIECVRCHCTDIRVLDINHINGGGTKETGSGQKIYPRIIDGTRKTDDLNILCKNCNWLHYLEMAEAKSKERRETINVVS